VAFTAFLDTCVLYPAYLCDTLLRLAEAEAYRPLWSADVLTELRRNLIERGLAADRVDCRITQMSRSFPGQMFRQPTVGGSRRKACSSPRPRRGWA
jgi:hypothetical protein